MFIIHQFLGAPAVLKIPYKGYEVSIAFESFNQDMRYPRSDIRVYKGEKDLTYKFEQFKLRYITITDVIEVIKHIEYLESDRYIDPIEDDRQNELKELQKQQKEFLAGFNNQD